ncbi:MAG TPA: ABC transporter substrate-binding protein, partial [Candidatus Methylomirabilis sp.]|nr:ABC transporter substrate-binding protein [Candidatus Methylomirabilis sp.]
MRHTRPMTWAVSVGLALSLVIGGPAFGQQVIKFGFIPDITGPASSLGVPERNTALMLQEEIDARGSIKGRAVKLVIYDGESTETKTLLAAKKAMEEDKVAALLCCTQSGTSLAIKNTVQAAKVPMVSMAASVKIVEPVKDSYWVFKTPQSDHLIAEVLADYLVSKKITRVAWMNVDNAFGDSGRLEFDWLAKKAGITVVANERFGDKDVDMTTQLTKVKGSDAQALVVWAIPPAASVVTKNAKELGLSIPLFHSHGVGNKRFIDLAGPAANGVRFPAGKLLKAEELPDTDPQKKTLVAYAKAYEAKYGAGSRSTFGGHGWDAIWLAHKATEAAAARTNPDDLPSFRAAIRDELEKIKEFIGISGIFNMSVRDHNGLDKRAVTMYEIVNGQWQLAK